MKDLCHDVFGIAKEKKDPRELKSNRGNTLSLTLEIFHHVYNCSNVS